MVDLIKLYEDGGFTPTASELPDFLPLFLEFAATRAPKRGARADRPAGARARGAARAARQAQVALRGRLRARSSRSAKAKLDAAQMRSSAARRARSGARRSRSPRCRLGGGGSALRSRRRRRPAARTASPPSCGRRGVRRPALDAPPNVQSAHHHHHAGVRNRAPEGDTPCATPSSTSSSSGIPTSACRPSSVRQPDPLRPRAVHVEGRIQPDAAQAAALLGLKPLSLRHPVPAARATPSAC